jgi:hypothetical protein
MFVLWIERRASPESFLWFHLRRNRGYGGMHDGSSHFRVLPFFGELRDTMGSCREISMKNSCANPLLLLEFMSSLGERDDQKLSKKRLNPDYFPLSDAAGSPYWGSSAQ